MSCSDASSTQNVANQLGGNANITAWDGKVTVFENGTISGEGVCRQYTPGNNSRILTDAETPKGTNAGKSGIGITLGVSEAGNIFKVGDNIAGKIVQKVLPGSNGKVAIVGRKIAGHVEDAASKLRAEGKQVEIFSELDQKNNLFKINGTNKSWQDIVDDFGNKNGQYLTNDKGWILDSELPKTMMY